MKTKFLVSILALALFSGCAGTNFSYADAKLIQPGMTTEQVITVMKTKPYVTEVHGEETVFVWVYGNLAGQVKQMRVRFDKDGHVIVAPVVP
jgi:hypothetical protein